MLSLYMCELLELPEKKTLAIYNAALIHDLGKVKLPIDILHKKEPLDCADWILIKEHPVHGAELLKAHLGRSVDELDKLVLFHHERIDGTGYPEGLTAGNIPLGSRIIAIADSLQAMISSRPYRQQPLKLSEAINEIINKAGTQFDEGIVTKTLNWLIE